MSENITYKWKVCVKCLTYNHANYITDALNGFSMQQTDFPYVCCIVDDCSTDGEQKVIKQYLQVNFDMEDKSVVRNEETDDYVLSFIQHKINKNCFFAVLFLKYNHHGKKNKLPYYEEWLNNAKYMALCEGDDYWIDPTKLQKQVDALETHPECTIAFCKVKNVSRKGTDLKSTKPNGDYIKPGVVTLNEFLKHQYGKGRWVFQTSGYFIRTNLYVESLNTEFRKKHPVGDEPLVIEYLLRGNGYYINKICSCYRVQSGGYTSHWRSNPELAVAFQKKTIEAISFLDEYTNKKYHDYIENRKLIAHFLIEYYQGNFKNLFKLKYLKLWFLLPKKTIIIMCMRFVCPPLYWTLKKYRVSS